MRLVVSFAVFLSAAAPFAQAAAVRPDAPKPPAPKLEEKKTPVPRPKLTHKQKKNKAFLAAAPELEAPRWTAPVRLTRLVPEFDEDNEPDAYLDLFLNEEAADLP